MRLQIDAAGKVLFDQNAGEASIPQPPTPTSMH